MIDGDELFNTLLRDFEANGVSAIHRLMETNPAAYLQIIAAVVCDMYEVTGD